MYTSDISPVLFAGINQLRQRVGLLIVEILLLPLRSA
jgi:hypothetical protein